MHASACTSIRPAGFKEPKVIILRNNSGADFAHFDIFEVNNRTGERGRFASISPVPKGVSQVFARGSSPKPLPDVVGVRWTDASGMEFNKQVSLKQILMQSTGRSGEALVFEVFQSNDVHVHLELQ